MILQPGQIVRVRSRRYLVEGVVPPPDPADSPVCSQNSSATCDELIVGDEAAHQDASRQA